MTTDIVVQQHWYGSAPTGLEVARGFQTLAHSAGLADFHRLKAHCTYKRPAGIRDGFPVNWGWFPLDADHVCLHRIGYAGTDELGRPGNFLAHNLEVRRADLEAIDWDVPLLLRWVDRHNPVRYVEEGGAARGFAGDYAQLYEALAPGQEQPERERLQSAPALCVPLEAIRQMRAESDRDWEAAFLGELRAKVNPDQLAAFTQAFLAPGESRRPVVVVGVGDGAEDGDLELKLVEYLFAVLPFHARRALTFATYEHEPGALFAPVRQVVAGPAVPGAGPRPAPAGVPPVQGPAPSRRRRLLMTTTRNEVRLPGAGQGDAGVWVWNTKTGELALPPASEVARVVSGWVREGQWPQVAAQRELASRFDYADEWQGVCDAFSLRDLEQRRLGPADYALYARLAASCRPGRPELLSAGNRLIREADSVLLAEPERLGEFGKGHIQLLSSQLPGLHDRERQERLLEAGSNLVRLFRWALAPGSSELLRYLFGVFSRSPNLADLRTRAASAFGEAVQADRSLHQRVEELLALWNKVRGESGEAEQARLFLGAVAQSLLALLEMADRSGQPFSHPPETTALPILESIPVETLEQLRWRLGLLDRLSKGPALGKLLRSLVRSAGLPVALLGKLAEAPHPLVLHHYQEWKLAASDPRVGRLLGDPGLLQLYCELLPHEAPHDSVPALLADLDAPARERACIAYRDCGRAVLVRGLSVDPSSIRGPSLPGLTRTHVAMLDLLARTAGTLPDYPEAGGQLAEHLLALTSLLLARKRPNDKGEPAPGTLEQPLRLVRQWYPSPEHRIPFAASVAARVAQTRNRFHPGVEDLPNVMKLAFQGWQQAGLDRGEASWHAFWLHEAVRQPDTPEAMTRRTAVRLLDQYPGVLEPSAATAFSAWLVARLDGEVWAGVARQMVRSRRSLETLAREAEKWFEARHGRAGLLGQLEAWGLLPGVAEELLAAHGQGGRDSLEALGILVNLPVPPQLAGPLQERLVELLLQEFQKLVQATDYVRQEAGENWEPGLAAAREVATGLCPLVTAGCGSLARHHLEWLTFFGEYAARALVSFGKYDIKVNATFRANYPNLHAFSRARARATGAAEVQGLADLFGHAAVLIPAEDFRLLYVMAGEALVGLGLAEDARLLAGLREETSLNHLFFSAGGAGWGRRSEPEDDLGHVLATAPREARDATLNDRAAYRAVLTRARFAAAVYGERPDKLAQVCRHLGFINGGSELDATFDARFSALALFGALSLDGTDAVSMFRARDRLLQTSFAKSFCDQTQKEGRMICHTLGLLVQQCLTPSELAAFLRPFQAKYKL